MTALVATRLCVLIYTNADFAVAIGTGNFVLNNPGNNEQVGPKIMKYISVLLVAYCTLFNSSHSQAFEPDIMDKMQLSVAQAMIKAKKSDPTLKRWFEEAHAYAVFPSVGKAGIAIGGAYGKGLVIQDDEVLGRTSLTQVTIGLQLGGQVYAEYIFFKDKTALNNFRRGNFEMGAQVSAVAVTAGASADTSYNSGVAVFTKATGGLMFEASVGGQKFKYRDY